MRALASNRPSDATVRSLLAGVGDDKMRVIQTNAVNAHGPCVAYNAHNPITDLALV